MAPWRLVSASQGRPGAVAVVHDGIEDVHRVVGARISICTGNPSAGKPERMMAGMESITTYALLCGGETAGTAAGLPLRSRQSCARARRTPADRIVQSEREISICRPVAWLLPHPQRLLHAVCLPLSHVDSRPGYYGDVLQDLLLSQHINGRSTCAIEEHEVDQGTT